MHNTARINTLLKMYMYQCSLFVIALPFVFIHIHKSARPLGPLSAESEIGVWRSVSVLPFTGYQRIIRYPVTESGPRFGYTVHSVPKHTHKQIAKMVMKKPKRAASRYRCRV